MASSNSTPSEPSSWAPTANIQEIFDAVNDAILVHDVQTGAILHANRKMYEMFGYSPEEIRHLDITALCGYGPICTHEFIRNLIAQAAAGAPQLFEWQVKNRDGRIFWVEVHLKQAIIDGSPRMLAVIRDITARRTCAQALQESEARYRMVTEGSLAGVYLGQEGGFLYVNQAFAEIFGYRPEDLMGGGVRPEDLVHPDDLPLVQEHVRRRLAGKLEAVHYTFRGRRRDGTVIYCEVRGRQVEYQGRPAIIGTLLDVTTQKHAEEAWRESEKTLQGLINANPESIFLIDTQGIVLAANPTTAHRLGRTVDDIIGACIFDFLPPEVARQRKAYNDQVIATGRPIRFEDSRDGIHFDVHIYPVLDEAGKVVRLAILGMDITLRQLAEEALHRRDAILEAVGAAAGKLLASASWQDHMQDIIGQLGRAAGVSRAYIFEQHLNPQGVPVVSQRYEWAAPGIAALINRAEVQELDWRALGLYAGFEEILLQGEIICGHTRDFPPPTRERWSRQGIQSILIVPILIGEEVWGVIGFDECLREREWLSAEIDALRTAASLLGAAIQRQRAEEALRASEAQYRTLVEQIPAITFTAALDDVTTHLYISPQIEAELGFSPDEWLANPETYKSRIHPEDRNRVLSELILSYAQGGPFLAEYRLLAKDGRGVWVRDESRAVHDLHGRPLFMQGVMLNITDRKQAEGALQAANQQLRALIEASPLAITAVDATGRVTNWNPAATRIFGWSREEALGRLLPFVPPGKQEESRVIRRSVLQGATISGMEVRRRRRDGSPVDISLSAAPVRDPAGNIIGVMGIIADITERRLFEEALIQSETRFRAIFESASVGILRTDLQGRAQESNAALRQMLGYRSVELRQLSIADLTHPDDLATDLRLFTELAAGKRDAYQLEKRYICKDGRWIWTRLSVSLVRNAAREPQFAIALVEDITERQKAEQALKESEEKYRGLMDSASDAILVADIQGNLLEANRSAERLLGYTEEELLQMNYRQLHPPENLDGVINAFQEIVTKGSSSLHDGMVVTKDGRLVPVDITGSVMEYAGKKIAQGIIRDITLRKKGEEALRQSERQLRFLASQLLTIQEKERRRVSRELHDELGQSLTALKMHLAGMQNQLRRDQQALKAGCDQLLAHIDGIIENVRRLSWDLSPTILEDLGLTSSLRYLVEETCRTHHMHRTVKMDNIDHLFTPETQINIYRIFQESLTNIVRYAKASRVAVSSKRERGAVSFSLTDNGIGFDLEQVRFRDVSQKSLGLTTMHERARLLGGTLQIRTQKGRGTRITLTVPIEN